MRFRHLFTLAVCAAFLVGVQAHAQTILTLEAPSTVQLQQSNQNPCIFGGPPCAGGPIAFTQFPGGNPSSYNEDSPVYTVQQLINVVGDGSFSVGIDVNRAGNDLEVLDLFEVRVNGTLEFVFQDSQATPGTLGLVNNGTGFSDSRLLGLDLSAFNPTDTVQFHVEISNATNGAESLFLISGRNVVVQKAVPAPGDTGLFDLLIDGAVVAMDVGDGGSGSRSIDIGQQVTVAEQAGTGTDLADYNSSLSCSGDGLTDPGGTTSATFTVPEGDGDIICIFTNTPVPGGDDSRTLILSKSLSPTDDDGLFDLLLNNSVLLANASHGDSTQALVSVGADITVSEEAGAGTSLSSYSSVLSCSGDGVTDPGGTTSATFTVPAGDGDITCTFTNTRLTRNLMLSKALSPTDDDGLFDLLLDGQVVAADASHNGGTTEVVAVGAEITVSEQGGTGTSLSSYSSVLSCSGNGVTDPGGTTSGTFTVPAGDGDITCTFTNTRLTRNLTLSKALSPTDDDGVFDLLLDGQVVLTDASHNDSTTEVVAVGAEITVSEQAGTGTSLAGYGSVLSCSGDGVTDPSGSTSATFTVPPGAGDITCTFTNTRGARSVVLTKALSPTDDDGLFDLTLDGQVVLSDASHGGSTTEAVAEGAEITVAELAGTGTSLSSYTSSLSCTGDGLTDPGGTTSATFTVPAGDGDITCTFTNTRLTRNLTLSKTLSPTDDDGLFDLTLDGQVVLADASHGDDTTEVVPVGAEITVAETGGTGTALSSYTSTLSCTGDGLTDPGGTTSATFTVPLGDGDITCAFTNTRNTRNLILSKALSPTDDEGLFDLTLDAQVLVADASHGDSGNSDVNVGADITIAELAGTDTTLANYSSSLSCSGDGVTNPGGTTSATFAVPPGDGDITCEFTNTRVEAPAGPALLSCVASAVPPVVRAEGIAELVGDIVVVCLPTGGAPEIDRYQVNISVSLNVNVTNNVDFAEPGVSDAVLVVNENNCTAPAVNGSTFSCGPDGRFQDPQFGRVAAANRLEWNRVDIPYPGADPDGPGGADPFPSATTIRITSVRGNASQLGVPESATFPSTQITAFVSVTGPTTLPLTNNVLNVAVPILGLIPETGDPIVGLQCVDSSEEVSIKLNEGFATAFKTIGVATFFPGNTQWESGYYAPGSNNGAGASQGTRFLLRFFNIPQGVDIEAPRFYTSQNGTAATPASGDQLELALVSGAAPDGDGGSLQFSPGTVSVDIVGGFGYVVYEVVDADPFRVESIMLPLTVSYESDTGADLPAVGTGQISASFAPLSTVTVASASEPEPRFIDSGGDPDDFITIVRCTTTLLFPFVTNQSGFDTGMAISNTSEDWLGTDPQAGACTIHYHGQTTGGGAAPAEQTSGVIGAGEQLLFTLSGGNPGQGIDGAPEFQGYVIAVCEFQYAHGFAFITDGFGGVRSMAQGYLALVIPTPFPDRVPGVPNLHGFGESLNH